MRRLAAAIALTFVAGGALLAHDPNGVPISWNREISRIVYERCVSCHHEGGTSFSLMTYQEAQPRAPAIKDAVLSRRMPPWGAVKGFGSFKDEQGLTQQQIELIADWVEGGTTRGNNSRMLPPLPKIEPPVEFRLPRNALAVTDGLRLSQPVRVAGVYPQHVPPGASLQIAAVRPNGDIEPLIWLYEFKDSSRHPFLFRTPLELPAQTVIRGVGPNAAIYLLPERNPATR
ncbi:MAG: cytochrome c [Acidobacteriota bacterium]